MESEVLEKEMDDIPLIVEVEENKDSADSIIPTVQFSSNSITNDPSFKPNNEKLKVALIRAPILLHKDALNNHATPSLGYAYIASFLQEQGYNPVIIDAIHEGLNQFWDFKGKKDFVCHGLTFKEIIDKIPKDSEVIGFSGMFSGEWPMQRALIQETRKTFPNALFVLGGEHASALSEYSLRDCPEVDLILLGEGESVFLELLEQYSKTKKFNEVNSICFLDKDNKFVKTGGVSRIKDMESIPWPYWPKNYLEKFWEADKGQGVLTGRDIPFIFSRGCPYQCTFCSNKDMYTQRYFLRDIDEVIKEIKYYQKKYKITGLALYDLTAIVKKEWIMDFCQRLLDENIKLNWQLPNGTRSEALDKDTLTMIQKTGCNYLVYAPESGSPETLKKIKKQIKLPRMIESIKTARKLGMVLRTNLIVGFPHESWKHVMQTYTFGYKLIFMGVEEVVPNIFSPYPGTEIFRNLQEEGNVKLSDEYFYSLTSINSAFLTTELAISYSPKLSPKILSLSRMFFIFSTYFLSYALRPLRIIRTFKNIASNNCATVFEQRLSGILRKNKEKAPTVNVVAN